MRMLRRLSRVMRFLCPVAGLMIAGMLFLASCGGGRAGGSPASGEKVEMRYATHLDIEEREGYTEVTVRNPWDTLRTLQRYYLVPRDSAVPSGLGSGVVIRTPVRNALVYTVAHAGLISELGALDAIGGVVDAAYMKEPAIKARISSGRIVDCGLLQSPDIEKIIQLHPDIILVSAFQNNDRYARAGELGIPVVEGADYMETSPLGQAEWMRFYGLLFGKSAEAERLFGSVESEYLRLKRLASETASKPLVLTDQRYGPVWNVPASDSTMGILIEDAGGRNPFSSYLRSGSVALAPEKVLGEAHDADIWLLRYYQEDEKSMAELAADASVNSRFRAFREGNVYGCNTRRTDIFEDTPFHPDRLLRDMVIVMHPGLLGDEKPVYYHRLK